MHVVGAGGILIKTGGFMVQGLTDDAEPFLRPATEFEMVALLYRIGGFMGASDSEKDLFTSVIEAHSQGGPAFWIDTRAGFRVQYGLPGVRVLHPSLDLDRTYPWRLVKQIEAVVSSDLGWPDFVPEPDSLSGTLSD